MRLLSPVIESPFDGYRRNEETGQPLGDIADRVESAGERSCPLRRYERERGVRLTSLRQFAARSSAIRPERCRGSNEGGRTMLAGIIRLASTRCWTTQSGSCFAAGTRGAPHELTRVGAGGALPRPQVGTVARTLSKTTRIPAETCAGKTLTCKTPVKRYGGSVSGEDSGRRASPRPAPIGVRCRRCAGRQSGRRCAPARRRQGR